MFSQQLKGGDMMARSILQPGRGHMVHLILQFKFILFSGRPGKRCKRKRIKANTKGFDPQNYWKHNGSYQEEKWLKEQLWDRKLRVPIVASYFDVCWLSSDIYGEAELEVWLDKSLNSDCYQSSLKSGNKDRLQKIFQCDSKRNCSAKNHRVDRSRSGHPRSLDTNL